MTYPSRPLVSVVTPSFNKGPFIEETIHSVLDQTYSEIEFIVIDGGSTDETLSILERYSDRLFWISESDDGQSDAINKGWRMAKGEIIAYLNADDTYLPGAIDSVVRYLQDHPEISLLYGDGILEDEQGCQLAEYRAGSFSLEELIFCRDNILQPSVFFRRHLLDTVGFLDVNLHLAMDLDYWIRVGLKDEISYLPQPLSAAKIYKDAKSSAFLTKYVEEYEQILKKVFQSPDVPPQIRERRSQVYSFIYIKGGLDALCHGQIQKSVRYIGMAIKNDPIHALVNGIRLVTSFGRKKIAGWLGPGSKC